MIGQTLGHYKILDKLGAGGMGEVYLAEDTTLKRQVALKVLPPDLAASQERLERFQREAESLAALNHPNIVHVYSVEEDEGTHFITMELVEGQPLSHLIKRGGLPLEQIFEFAIPLADALATAHDKGIIHRDLKPANIMVTDEGRVKVLDFGLAKLRQESQKQVASELPTELLTGEGRIIGTVPYMSPEQVEGKVVDHRTDVFSLGVVLYEMATGERPFKGDTSVSVISSILKERPTQADSLRTALPHHLARIIRHCLEKEPARRFQSALDVRNELEDLRAEADSGDLWNRTIPAAEPHHWKRWIWSLSAVAVAALGMAGYAAYRGTIADSKPSQAAPSPLSGTHRHLTFEPGAEMDPSFSPDGRSFVYGSRGAGNRDIYHRRVSGGKVINLTEGSATDDFQPAFSPNGEQIAFRSERDGGGIFLMGAMGEDVRQLTDFGYYPAWSPDGERIVFTTGWQRYAWSGNKNQRIWTVAVASGELQEVLDHSALQPDWSPSGQRIAFSGTPPGVDVGSDIFTVPATGGEPTAARLGPFFDAEPIWAPDGRYLYFRRGRRGESENLWRVPIDEETGEVLGEEEPVTSGTFEGVGGLSISRDGDRLAYHVFNTTAQIQSVAFDPEMERVIGGPTPVTPQGLDAFHPSVSPDGEWIAFAARFAGSGSMAIGIIRTDGTGLRQLTDSGHVDYYPAWSPDSQRIAFFSNRSGSGEAWIVQRDGSGVRQLTNEPDKIVFPPRWSPDGRRLATTVNYGSAYIFDADTPWTEQPPTELPRFEAPGSLFWQPWSWSPNGSLLAGIAAGENEDGIEAGGIVLFSFDTGEYRYSIDFGWNPLWLADGRRVLFTAEQKAPSKLCLLDTETGEYHEVLSAEILEIAPDRVNWWPGLSPDNRAIFFTRLHDDADIWMLTLGDQE